MSRVLISLLGIYQQEDGSVKLPEALVTYVGKGRIDPPGTRRFAGLRSSRSNKRYAIRTMRFGAWSTKLLFVG